MTVIDRVVHNSVILDLMQMRSFRVQQATGQQASPASLSLLARLKGAWHANQEAFSLTNDSAITE
jgi:hypothetical protein